MRQAASEWTVVRIWGTRQRYHTTAPGASAMGRIAADDGGDGGGAVTAGQTDDATMAMIAGQCVGVEHARPLRIATAQRCNDATTQRRNDATAQRRNHATTHRRRYCSATP